MSRTTGTPETLRDLVQSALEHVGRDTAGNWNVEFYKNRVKFTAEEREFIVRHRGSKHFTISYGYAAGKTTTRHCDQNTSFQIVCKLLTRTVEA